ncbi:MAG: nucleoside-diphosphate sugar epimerase/dehydratase [Burkholderiales bacterium]
MSAMPEINVEREQNRQNLTATTWFPRWPVVLAFLHDLIAATVAWIGSFVLLYNLHIPVDKVSILQLTLLIVVPLQTITFAALGMYRGLWRYTGVVDLKRILLAVGVASIAAALVALLLRTSFRVPGAILLIDPILLLPMIAGSRLAARALVGYSRRVDRSDSKPVIVMGAGEAAALLLRDLARSKQWCVVGLLDDNSSKHNRYLHGVKILGKLDEIDHWSKIHQVKDVIIAIPSAPIASRKNMFELCAKSSLRAMTVPAIEDLVSGKVTVSQMRKVEVADLLRRDPVVLDDRGMAEFIHGRCVLVTGAGGSIGSELCRQIAVFKPSRLLLFEMNEFALYNIEQEFREQFPGVPIASIMGDVKNASRVDQVLAEYRPVVIFHAAAYKHVPLVEDINTWEAIRNNVCGTYTVANAALRHGIEKFVLISTDKAVNPTNVMGASKRLAEMVCQSLQGVGKTRFAMVRFGNVLGSTGSVIPKFYDQINKGGPVTVTHPDVIRYFMSIPEAAQLVLQAGYMGRGGEIFVMEMGEPVRIADMARDMIRLSGFSEEEIKITYTGLRPGEKLYEELLADDEQTVPTHHPMLRIARAREVDMTWIDSIRDWFDQPRILSDAEVRAALRKWVPEYAPKAFPH